MRVAQLLMMGVVGLAGCQGGNAPPVPSTDGPTGAAADLNQEGGSAPSPALAADLLRESITDEMRAALDDPDDDQLELLLRLMRNSDAAVRVKALRAIEELELTADLEAAIIARAADPVPAVRIKAMEQITYFGIQSPEALNALGRLAQDRDAKVQKEAIEYIQAFGDDARALAPVLMNLLAHKDDGVVRRAIDALKEVGPPAEAAPLLQAKFDEHGETALYAIAKIEPPAAELIPWLRGIMTGRHDFDRRLAAAWALGRYGEESTLLEAAASGQAETRALGMEGIGGLRQPSPQAIERLTHGLTDDSQVVRERAAEGVGYLRPPPDDLLIALMRAMGDSQPKVRDTAREALESLEIEEQLTAEQGLALVDQALAETPTDVGLLMAKAALSFEVARNLLYDAEGPEKSLEQFNAGAKGLVQVVLKSGLQLSRAERDAIGTYFYDAACAAARSEKPEMAVQYLNAALTTGWRDLRWLKEDSDLDSLRELPAYQALLEKFDRPRP